MDRLPTPRYEVTRIDKDGKHLYQVQGEDTGYLGTTTPIQEINKPWLTQWALRLDFQHFITKTFKDSSVIKIDRERCEKQWEESSKSHAKYTKQTADIGTRFHESANHLLEGRPFVVEKDIKTSLANFQKWLSETPLEFVAGEVMVASRMYEYGGTIDAIFKDKKGRLYICDFKTSNGWRPFEWALQIGAYCHAFIETYPVTEVGGFVVRVSRDKKQVETRRITDWRPAWKTFHHLLEVYRAIGLNFWKSKNAINWED